MAAYGTLNIPSVSMNRKAVKWIENGVVGEGGNGGRFIPPAGASPGSKGSLDRSIPGIETVATGHDAQLQPSEVDFGLVGTYVAQIAPSPGMTDAQVLQELTSLLDANGVAAMYNSTTIDLSVDIPDGVFLDWGNTDTGLNFTMSTEGLAAPLPVAEPEPIAIDAVGGFGLGLALLAGRRKQKKLRATRSGRGFSSLA